MSKYKKVEDSHYNTEDTETGYFIVSEEVAASYRYYVFKHDSSLYMIEYLNGDMFLSKYDKTRNGWYDFMCKPKRTGKWVEEVIGGGLMLPVFRQALTDHFFQKFSKLGSLL